MISYKKQRSIQEKLFQVQPSVVVVIQRSSVHFFINSKKQSMVEAVRNNVEFFLFAHGYFQN